MALRALIRIFHLICSKLNIKMLDTPDGLSDAYHTHIVHGIHFRYVSNTCLAVEML